MRFIYLSKTSETIFKTKDSTYKFFEEFIKGTRKTFNIKMDGTKKPIDKDKFKKGEDLFFVIIEDLKKEKVKIVAYCKSKTELLESNDVNYPIYFEPAINTIKIFKDGIDIDLFNNFVYRNKIREKEDYFTSFICDGKTKGSPSWRWFNDEESIQIMEWFKEVVFKNYNFFETVKK